MALSLNTPSSSWDDTPGPNPNYMCTITCNSGPGAIPTLVLPMPEQMSFSVASNYDTPFSQGIIRGSIGEGLSNFAKAFGVTNGVTQGMTAQIWQGTNDIELSLTFELVAVNDAEQDVMTPIRNLMKLTMPNASELGGFLTPPGPTLSNYVMEKVGLSSDMSGKIMIEIGRYIKFPNVVITHVNSTFSSHLDANGKPMKANVDVTFKTFFVPVKSDLPQMLPG